jgi:YfiH family protein
MKGPWVSLKSHDSSIEIGMLWKFENYKIIFGNRNLTEVEFKECFPHVELLKIKQTHSSKVVLASKEIREADAQYSASSNVALQIKTADCIPLFIFDPRNKIIMAVHAGWRGVVGKIAEKAVQEMLAMGSKPIDLRVLIGPHIQMQSFEVDQPVWVELMDSIPVEFHHEVNRFFEKVNRINEYGQEKYKVDLEGIVRTQLRKMGVSEENMDSLPKDTLTETLWHSHRRDKENAGRNISFILRDD